jgi:hypothetical protein
MKRPDDTIIEAVSPARNIDDLPIADLGVRNVVGAELRSSLRLPRRGPHDATLVALSRYYDGLQGGEAGKYYLVYLEFRATGSRWRTVGVKVRAAEAARVARDMLAGKPSKPGRSEKPRVGGKVEARDDSVLLGSPVMGGYILYVKSKNRVDAWVRTRGVEVLTLEIPIVANALRELAASKD